jgi:uncharacterized caspase-like protein
VPGGGTTSFATGGKQAAAGLGADSNPGSFRSRAAVAAAAEAAVMGPTAPSPRQLTGPSGGVGSDNGRTGVVRERKTDSFVDAEVVDRPSDADFAWYDCV